ncbi:MAG: hypothetical protein WBH59_00505 [Atribacterales bacterium]
MLFIVSSLVVLTFIFPVKLNCPSHLHLQAGGEEKVEEIEPLTLWGFPSWFQRATVAIEDKELIFASQE